MNPIVIETTLILAKGAIFGDQNSIVRESEDAGGELEMR